jgi:hypothetical protein
MRATMSACLVVALAAASTAQAGQPKLVGETVLMEAQSEFFGIPWIVRLSPDGEHLLFTRGVRGKEPVAAGPGKSPAARPRGGSQVVLRHWKTRREKIVPIPLLTDVSDVLMTAMAMNPFSADGKRLVVPACVDADGDGVWSARQEKLQAAVYDVASGKLQRIGAEGERMVATFDASGKHVIFVVVEAMRPLRAKMYVAPADTLKPRALKTWGLPRTARPGGNTLALAKIILPPDGGRPTPKFVLYDYVKDAKVAEFPIHERNVSLNDVTPQWTADGRYLYYVDQEMEPAGEGERPRRKRFTSVWDVKQNKEVARLSDSIAIGPCGGTTTMVLLGKPSAAAPALLHDARTGKVQPLTHSTAIYPISTTGKYVIYDRRDGRGKHVICRAEIRMVRGE